MRPRPVLEGTGYPIFPGRCASQDGLRTLYGRLATDPSGLPGAGDDPPYACLKREKRSAGATRVSHITDSSCPEH